MRILAILLMAGSAALAANPLEKEKGTAQVQASSDVTMVEEKVDRTVTGQTLSGAELDKWEQQRKEYLECPECVANQPFPGE